MLAQEHREAPGSVWATEAGGVASGSKGSLHFGLDARMFTESRDGAGPASYDRETIDIQGADRTGSFSYVSYARYRGFLTLDTPLGRLRAAREAPHWGPGLFTNLMFNQDAIPFHQFSFQTGIGPFSVTSLYGDLLVGGEQVGGTEKRLYAHRYEWRMATWLTAGVSEQILLVDVDKPYLFVPIFPLFIAKSFMQENSNNGSIAWDLAWRWRDKAMLYGEFLLDDLESPSSLFTKNYRQDKWAFMSGMHFATDWREARLGLVAEYSRVEPWVYTHFDDFPAQAANLSVPLGNPLGPNSQAVLFKAYGRFPYGLYAGLKVAWTWKGADSGSGIFDPYLGQDHHQPKYFIQGVDPDFSVNPSLAYNWRFLNASLSVEAGSGFRSAARLAVIY